MLRVNLIGTVQACAAVVPGMVRRGSGSVVTISSDLGVGGSEGDAHYATTKGAIVGFTRGLAVELAGTGVRVNSVAPGAADTPMLAARFAMASRDVPVHLATGPAGTAGRDRGRRRIPARAQRSFRRSGALTQLRGDDLMTGSERLMVVMAGPSLDIEQFTDRLVALGERVALIGAQVDSAALSVSGDEAREPIAALQRVEHELGPIASLVCVDRRSAAGAVCWR